MKNQKGISLIALIITIIVIIILAAIVIGGVFNTPNDAKFANFCQEYDRVQTAIQLRYYELYQKYAIANTTAVPTHFAIYKEVADGTSASTLVGNTAYDKDGWVAFTNWKDSTHPNGICEKPSGLNSDWFLRMNDGKLAYAGFEKSEADMYYTPNLHADDSTGNKKRAKLTLDGTAPNQTLKTTETVALSDSTTLALAN